jgi:sterol desaturase/sphingolipid hydroxylase (fatty acid hydroxylase superfamily)
MSYFEQFTDFQPGGEEVPSKYLEAIRVFYADPGTVLLTFLITIISAIKAIAFGINFVDFLCLGFLYFIWCIVEWAIHLYIWHAEPLPLVKKEIKTPGFDWHVNHHKHPWDYSTILFKLSNILIGIPILFIVLLLILPSTGLAMTILVCAMLMILLHEWYHFLAHTNINPVFAPVKNAIECHRKHHYEDPNRWMGVCATFPDKLFGTYSTDK